MKSLQSQVDELKATVAALTRQVSRQVVQPANVPNKRQGRHFAVLNGSLAQGGTATAEILSWELGDTEWIRSGHTVTVQDFWLNDGETIEADTRLEVVWYHNVWVPAATACAPADNLPE